MIDVARRLVEVRETAGLDVLQLALKFGIQSGQIYQAEAGKRKPGAVFLGRYVDHGLMTDAEAFRLQREAA